MVIFPIVLATWDVAVKVAQLCPEWQLHTVLPSELGICPLGFYIILKGWWFLVFKRRTFFDKPETVPWEHPVAHQEIPAVRYRFDRCTDILKSMWLCHLNPEYEVGIDLPLAPTVDSTLWMLMISPRPRARSRNL